MRKRDLPVEKKSLMSNEQNKDNARRTRIRKKIYDLYLRHAIEDTEFRLVTTIDPKFFDELGLNETFQKHSANRYLTASFNSIRPSINIEIVARRNALRIEKIKEYVNLRFSNEFSLDRWLSLCEPDIIHSMTTPIYRNKSKFAYVEASNYVCTGVKAIIDDNFHRIDFIESLVCNNRGVAYCDS